MASPNRLGSEPAHRHSFNSLHFLLVFDEAVPELSVIASPRPKLSLRDPEFEACAQPLLRLSAERVRKGEFFKETFHMAAGNQQSGEYSFKFTSFTLTPGPGGSIVIQGNCEGTATGYGTGLGTMTAVGGNSGTVSWCARQFLESGELV